MPIINENDTVAVEELQTTFGDNDRLAAIVTNLIRAPLLVLLSDVDGLFDGDPSQPGQPGDPHRRAAGRRRFTTWSAIAPGGLSKGGMASKLEAARLATTAGENVIIAGGRTPDVLPRIIAGEPVGTLFLAQGQTVAARKRWIGLTVKPRGRLVLDAGAQEAVRRRGPQPAGRRRRRGRGQVRTRATWWPCAARRRRVRPRTDQLRPTRTCRRSRGCGPARSPTAWAIAPTTR